MLVAAALAGATLLRAEGHELLLLAVGAAALLPLLAGLALRWSMGLAVGVGAAVGTLALVAALVRRFAPEVDSQA